MSELKLIKGSCIEQTVDAIANAANKNLIPGLGVSGAIFNKAGYDLINFCRTINKPLEDGEAVITPSFNITNAKYIIHAVGPDFAINPSAFDKLFNAYYNSLKLLKENNLHSISFPLISSGIYGGNLDSPVKESTKQCIKAYNRFVEENKDYEAMVLLCCFSDKEYSDAKEVFI